MSLAGSARRIRQLMIKLAHMDEVHEAEQADQLTYYPEVWNE